MAGTGMAKSESDNLEAEKEFREEAEQRQEGRRIIERSVQQDLNQGMGTGTHSSAHSGVNWGPSYRMRPEIAQAPSEEQIRVRAYELYLQRSAEDGQDDLGDWLTAEEELTQGNR
jgi:hypothetical protein